MPDKKTAVVTGGSRGIGFATAKLFLKEGYNLSLCSRSQGNLGAARKSLSKTGKLMAMVADIRDYKQVKAFIDKTQEKFETIDILVNNAGVAWAGQLVKQPVKSISELIDVNLKGMIFVTRSVLEVMRRQKQGTIINISSGAGKTGIAELATYSATKFGVIGFSQSLNQELAGSGIRVFALCPGRVATDMQLTIHKEKAGMPPEKIAEKVLQLVGDNPPVKPGECLEVYR